ncbi:ATP-binding cassette domain-containing protein [Cohnella candidum]|uniref:ATP-binding cassette domain-containing protein n=1 Tax=Cohnella candidum TaxID=2674991 RepID=A0A3G3JV18_9BACL|nr:ATP-binding cassette domain-containing protein [Cohnella candidum]AYQ72066.1 ATP-binding cassette domain-containing protein [Cohnella candidum]
MAETERESPIDGGFRGIALTLEGTSKLTLEPGTLTLVMGANGAGKTVFLEKAAGLREPEGLAFRYGAEPLWIRSSVTGRPKLNPKALLLFGYAGQSPEQGLFLRSVQEEIDYSLRPYKKSAGSRKSSTGDAAAGALAAVGWDESWLTRDPFRMSGGERRRASLAALFATPAPWLLLDEPTAGLDRDGHRVLGEHLERLKRDGRGILLVSHDADWALPLADRVLLIHPDGGMSDCRPEQLVAEPERLERAGMQVPAWMRVLRRAWQAGLGIDGASGWHPAEAAEALCRPESQAAVARELPEHRAGALAQLGMPKRRKEEARTSPLTGFDPRAIWFGYVLLSVGLFSLSSWGGLAAGLAVVCVILAAARIPLLRWRGIIAGFIVFGTLLAAWAALDFNPPGSGLVGWDFEVFAGTMFPFARTLTVLLIGLGVPLVMTPLSLRRALEQLATRKDRVPAFWQRIVLTVTLTVRFVPVLLAEWERFGRIFLARGKETGRSPGIWFRRLRGVTLPLLLALFRLADEVAVALESRGVRGDVQPTRSSRLKWRAKDTALATCAAILAGLLWFAG